MKMQLVQEEVPKKKMEVDLVVVVFAVVNIFVSFVSD